jgi:uncharacterized surface protein with fasciclin (FAS1) repeats
MNQARHLLVLACGALLATIPACSKNGDGGSAKPGGGASQAASDLGTALRARPDMSKIATALSDTGVGTVFSGKGSYTLVAPDDSAFAKLGEQGGRLSKPDQRAALAALVRDHIVPGYLTPQDIGKAIDAADGKPVKMRTMGTGELSFTRSGSTISVSGADGASGKLGANPVAGGGSIALPVDPVLKKV